MTIFSVGVCGGKRQVLSSAALFYSVSSEGEYPKRQIALFRKVFIGISLCEYSNLQVAGIPHCIYNMMTLFWTQMKSFQPI
jgi:hypothetical protein